MTFEPFNIGHVPVGGPVPFFILGPCSLESESFAWDMARSLKDIADRTGIHFIFKASFDKANRTSISSFRGPGPREGCRILGEIGKQLGVPVTTDIHTAEQADIAAEFIDLLQIPAFLCRQTDLLVAAAKTGRALHVKKGQFLAPWDMKNVVKKVVDSGNENVMVCERGASFGYGRLVVDMTGFAHMAATGKPVVFDATHSVQEPGALGDRTGGDRTKVPALARAAVATGHVDGVFFEVHPDPDCSPSDGPNMVKLSDFERVLDGVLAVHAAARAHT